MPDPPHCLQLLLRRLCLQMLDPPHSLQPLFLAVVLADAQAAALLV
jgi:hypothetical protein